MTGDIQCSALSSLSVYTGSSHVLHEEFRPARERHQLPLSASFYVSFGNAGAWR